MKRQTIKVSMRRCSKERSRTREKERERERERESESRILVVRNDVL